MRMAKLRRYSQFIEIKIEARLCLLHMHTPGESELSKCDLFSNQLIQPRAKVTLSDLYGSRREREREREKKTATRGKQNILPR